MEKKRRFVVGHPDDDEINGCGDETLAMTLDEAKQDLADRACEGFVIYELVPVESESGFSSRA